MTDVSDGLAIEDAATARVKATGLLSGDEAREAARAALSASTSLGIPRNPSAERMREAGRFLLDRLVDHEVRMTSDEDARDWFGHVSPAMARFRSALSTIPKEEGHG